MWINRSTIEDVFDAPIARNDWKLSNIDYFRIRYTLLQRVKKELDALSPILSLGEGRKRDEIIDTKESSFEKYCFCINESNFIQGKGDTPINIS